MLSVGDKGTIKRGKAKGQGAEVVYATSTMVTVKLQDGTPIVLDESSFEKAPEPTIELKAVARAITSVRGRYPDNEGHTEATLDELASDLGVADLEDELQSKDALKL